MDGFNACTPLLLAPSPQPPILFIRTVVVKQQKLCNRRSQAESPAPSFINGIILGNIFIFSESQFPPLKSRNDIILIGSLGRFSEKLWIKDLAQHLTYSRCLISSSCTHSSIHSVILGRQNRRNAI